MDVQAHQHGMLALTFGAKDKGNATSQLQCHETIIFRGRIRSLSYAVEDRHSRIASINFLQ